MRWIQLGTIALALASIAACDGAPPPASPEVGAVQGPLATSGRLASLDDGAGAACPQAHHFLDPTGASAGPGYPEPWLEVTCAEDEVLVSSNGIPSFTFTQVTPNPLGEQDYAWRIPRYPEMADATTAVPLVSVAAIAVDGLPIFGPTEAPGDGSRDPVLDELLDYCNGHTAPGGVYHFHGRPDCLLEGSDPSTPYQVLGYALDGFPILSPWVCADAACTATYELRSSWRQIEEVYGTTLTAAWDAHEYVPGLGDLDECNGAYLPDGRYAYFATTTFPYFMGCYRGTPVELTGAAPPPPPEAQQPPPPADAPPPPADAPPPEAEEPPPADQPSPDDQPPADQPPPPADQPSVDQPPVDQPPADQSPPPADQPPPPADQPPADQPPADQSPPPADQPPQGDAGCDDPSGDDPPPPPSPGDGTQPPPPPSDGTEPPPPSDDAPLPPSGDEPPPPLPSDEPPPPPSGDQASSPPSGDQPPPPSGDQASPPPSGDPPPPSGDQPPPPSGDQASPPPSGDRPPPSADTPPPPPSGDQSPPSGGTSPSPPGADD